MTALPAPTTTRLADVHVGDVWVWNGEHRTIVDVVAGDVISRLRWTDTVDGAAVHTSTFRGQTVALPIIPGVVTPPDED